MAATQFSIGRDCQLVVLGPAGRVDLSYVTGFESRQVTQPVRVDRLDGVQMATELPKGWEGSFEVERGSSAVDDFIAAAEAVYRTTGALPYGMLYQYVNEPNGSTSTYQYIGVTFRLAQAGVWRGDASVKQKLEFLRRVAGASVMVGPAARIVADASAGFEAVGGDGRRYTLRRMTVLDRLRLFKALGGELAANDAYLGIAYYACAVTAIDDVPVPAPASVAQIEALVGRLGDDGIDAVAQACAQVDAAGGETDPGN